uniref:Uncharacterized protein n=1 Tax=Cacopsylla melanoneura TaxID=428564 RepID=A0A8D9B2W1_9HEMI
MIIVSFDFNVAFTTLGQMGLEFIKLLLVNFKMIHVYRQSNIPIIVVFSKIAVFMLLILITAVYTLFTFSMAVFTWFFLITAMFILFDCIIAVNTWLTFLINTVRQSPGSIWNILSIYHNILDVTHI